MFDRQDYRIGDNVVDEVGAHRGGKTLIVDLDRRRAMRENARPTILCMAGQIDCDINLTIVEQLGDFFVAPTADIMKLIKCRDHPLSRCTAVIHTE